MSAADPINTPAVVADLVTKNQGLVHMVARQCRWAQLDYEDLVASGNEGLVVAAQRFDTTRDVKFSTFAFNWIRAFVWRFVENNVHAVRIPNGMHRKLRKFWKGEVELTSRMEEALSAMRAASSIDAPLGSSEDDDRTLGEMMASDDPGPEALVAEAEHARQRRAVVRAAVSKLTPRMQEVINQRHLGGGKKLREIAEAMGVTRQRVRQLETKAMKMLERSLARGLKRAEEVRMVDVDDAEGAAALPPKAEEWITTKQAAEILGVSNSWFAAGRDRDFGPDGQTFRLSYRHDGSGFVRYERESVLRVAQARNGSLAMPAVVRKAESPGGQSAPAPASSAPPALSGGDPLLLAARRIVGSWDRSPTDACDVLRALEAVLR